MAELTAAKRRRIPSSEFAGPNRSYPVEDKAHARNAKARASQAYHEGRITRAERDRIYAKADRVLYGGSHPSHGHVYVVEDEERREPKPDTQPQYRMKANIPRRQRRAPSAKAT